MSMNLLSEKILSVFLLTILLRVESEAESLCESDIGTKIACNAVLIGGTVVLTFSYIANKILPSTDIKVRMPDGSIQSAKLTYNGQSGRIVKTHDILDLDCKINEKPYAGDYGYASCELKFPNLTPRPESVDYFQKTGKQSSWFLGANKEGILDNSIITLSSPIIWSQYK